MKFFAKNFPEKLNSSILISEVIAKKVRLKKHGKEFMGCCPFHNEKTPSFTVNDQKGFYHCFGCSAHGSAINFVMETEGLEFRDAVVSLANDFGIDIPWEESRAGSNENAKKIDRNHEIAAKILEIYQNNLQQARGGHAKKYLISRGFDQQVIEDFKLGYAVDSYVELNEQLKKEGFSEAEILKCGVVSKNDRGKLYDKFRNRVVFPIFDIKNRVIAFGGRVMDKSLPKYMNSAETEIFKKNQTLFNLNNARKAIFDKKYAIVVEGYADVLALAAKGVENVVAGLGTALGENHLKLLFKITDKVLLCFDGDKAGIKAASRFSELALPLINVNKNIKFLFLPNNMDPDDFIKENGKVGFEKYIKEEAVAHSEALVNFTLDDNAIKIGDKFSAEKKAKIESDLMKKAEIITDNISKKYFIRFFNDFLFKIDRFDKKKGQKQDFAIKNIKLGSKKHISNLNYDDLFAQNIIALLIKSPKLVDYHDEKFDMREIFFENEELNNIKDEIISQIEENNEVAEKNLLKTLENYSDSGYNRVIKALIKKDFAGFENLAENEIYRKTRLLLLKNLMMQVEKLYKQALSKIDEIDTHSSAVNDDKIMEIFAYKNEIEQEVLDLESQIIGD